MYNFDSPNLQRKLWGNIKGGARVAVLLWLLATLSGKAQDKIEGIGKFKIGKTNVSITEEIAKETGDKINIMDEYLNMGTERYRIGEIIVNKTYPDRSPEEASFCPNVRIFQINTYEVAGVEIKDLTLTFKDGLLIGLSCAGSVSLAEALNLKYGPPVIKTEKKKVTCAYALNGNKLDLNETKYTQNWTNGKIIATAITGNFYDNNCNRQFTDTFTVRDPALLSSVVQCDKAVKAKLAAKKQAQDRKALSDF